MPRLLPLLLLLATPLHARDATAGRAGGPITIDGALTEPGWATVDWQTGFTQAEATAPAETPAAVQTRFKVLCDATTAYVAVQCDEPRPEVVKAAAPWRDGAVWQDDCVEIFLDPAGEGRYYHQVMVNSRGQIYDCYGADYGIVKSKLWNGAVSAAGQVDAAAKQWTVEVAIPFGTLVLAEDAGTRWKWNVTRERHAGGTLELSTWSPLQGNFHQPRLWGSLAGLPSDYAPFRLRLGEPHVDVSRSGSGASKLDLRLTVRNETGKARRLKPAVDVLETPDIRAEGEVFALADNAEAEIALPTITVRGSSEQTNLVFRLTDAETGELLKAQVKNVASEARPLKLTVTTPCYRNNIYATETVDAIVFRVEPSAEVRQRMAKVVAVLSSLTAVARAEATVEALAEPLRLPVPGLPVGSYELQVTALDAAGAEVASASTPIRKLPPPPSGHEVRIDEQRNILVDGKPVLFIGWYGGIPTNDPRPEVLALQNLETPMVLSPDQAGALGEKFRARGVYSILSVENGRLYYSFNLWQQGKEELAKTREEIHTLTAPSEALKGLAKELVDACRGQDGLLGYYIADEPEIHDIPSAYLEHYYQYLAEIDPYHPVFVTNDTIDGLVTHGYRCADVLSPDPYSPAWDYVPSFLQKANEVARPGQAFQLTPWHSSSQAHFTRDYGTAPPYPFKVLRNQYLASVCYGVKGWTGYTSAFFMPENVYRYGLPEIWRELRFLEPAIFSPAPAAPVVVEGSPELATWVREVNGQIYLLVVNHKPGAAQGTVRWPGLKGRKSLQVAAEERQVAIDGDGFPETWEEGDAHLYTSDPQGADLATLKQIETFLEICDIADDEPGNLLHWKRGVKARWSAGYYAPWFDQYPYYAINGITDDLGWSQNNWDDKPRWLELTLPKEQAIGRVVIETPNLKDYTIDFGGADGVTMRLTVTDNQETTIEHRFAPPPDCLKLRLTATTIRPWDGPRGKAPIVSEIKAYRNAGLGPTRPLTVVQGTDTPAVKPLFADAGEPATLWTETWRPFKTNPQFYWDQRDDAWVVDPAAMVAEAATDGGIVLASQSPQGYAGASRILPYDPAYRFLQLDLAGIEGEGYRFTSLQFRHTSGKGAYRRAINTNQPGIYTVDTWALSDNYRTGADKTALLTLGVAGAKKLPDGTANPGPRFTYRWLRLARQPVDGLSVTLADGAPLPETLTEGLALQFEVHLSEPAQDVVVDARTGSSLSPLSINGQPYVQLRQADGEGRNWTAQVTLGTGTGTFKLGGYPLVFRASVTGGAIESTLHSAFVGVGG